MTRKRFCEKEIAFIELMAPLCRAGDISAALQRPSARGIQRVMAQNEIRGRQRGEVQPMAREAVKEAWRRYQAGLQISSNLRYWSQDSGSRTASHRREWTLGDDETLREFVGREPIRDIAKRLRRTVPAVKDRLWTLGIRHKTVENTCGKLAAKLKIAQTAINAYCHGNKPRLRSWLEGRWRVVHVDDAEWLLEHYRYYETPWERMGQAA